MCVRARSHLESRREGNQNKDIFASLCIYVCARACVHKYFVGQLTVTTVATVTTVTNVHLCVHVHVRVGAFQVICVSKETQWCQKRPKMKVSKRDPEVSKETYNESK